MRTIVLAAVALLAFGVVPAAAQKKPSFYIVQASSTDQPARPGQASSEAAAAASVLENFVAAALQDKYPCSSTLTDSEAGQLLGLQRQRELLGAGGTDQALASLAGSVGAGDVVSVQVTQAGGSFSVTVVVVDTRTAKAISRSHAILPANDDAADALQAFATSSVGAVTGPRCPGWTGTVTVVSGSGGSGKDAGGKPFTASSSLQMTCILTGRDSTADCTVSLNSTLSGNDSDYGKQAKATVPVAIDVGVEGTKSQLHIGLFTIVAKSHLSIAGMGTDGTEEMQLGGWTVEGAAPARPGDYSGSWSDGKGMTIAWNLLLK